MGKKLSAYNLHMKRSLKGKMKGKTKAQRKAIFKAAARAWKSKKKGNPKPRSKPKSGGSRRGSSTTRRSNRVGRKGGFNTQKLFKLIRLGALVLPAAGIAMSGVSTQEKLNYLRSAYFGVRGDGTFHLEDLARGWLPYLASIGVTYGIPKVAGLIRGL